MLSTSSEDDGQRPCCSKSITNANGNNDRSDANRMRKRRKEETAEQRKERLAKDAARKRARRAAEAPMQTQAVTRINKLQDVAERAFENEFEINEHFCGSMTSECTECNAFHFESEKFQTRTVPDEEGNLVKIKTYTKCCKNGQIKLENLREYPEPFLSLMKKTDPLGVNFMENIRAINSSFAFASMGANYDRQAAGKGPYCFRIHGQIYHRAGTLHPEPGRPKQFAQLYILDSEQANAERAKHVSNRNVDTRIFDKVSIFMESNNKFCQAYKMMHEVEKESMAEAEQDGIVVDEVKMIIFQDRNQDSRRYNAAAANEVAIVFSNKDGLPPLERDLMIHLRPQSGDQSNGMQRIDILNKNIEALIYPLLFPFGEQGWGVDLLRNRTGSRVRVSQMEYYCYRLAVRDSFNPLLNAGKLTQQYFVDAYVKTEGNHLNFILNNQKELRGDSLKGLQDFILNQDEVQGKTPGIPVILPSSFPGGPRYMIQNYQDAMSIVAKYGKPDLFITMTCNPKWREIKDNLQSWQQAEHRPDLVARVFDLKLKELLGELTDKSGGIFGKVVGHVHVIEFQKRGLPHAHILLIMDNESKLSSEEKIDKVVKAEIPDKEKNPKLYDIVTSHMIHGPCGKLNPSSPCMKDNVCQKKFPRAFVERTLGNDSIQDGYALYQRRKGNKIVIKGKEIDNSWVVPYNPYLSLKYNCHINVEVCASVQSVKYLFKYVYKGHDCANIKVTDGNVVNRNEVNKFVDTRYVSAPEAAWRLFGNDMHGHSHSIERLAVHLPDEQFVVFDANPNIEFGRNNGDNDVEESELQRQVRSAQSKHTTLTGWFELNRRDETARQYFYYEIPMHFTWLKGERKWKIRERFFNKIGRMYTVNPNDSERFYLRLLLLHTKGATSFEYLKTVDGQTFDTFRDAAKARGLLMDDSVWQSTLDDAISLQMPHQLRQVFVYICAYGAPSDPRALWYNNLSDFTEDICHKVHGNVGNCRNCEFYALKDIKQALNLLGKHLSDLGLPEPPMDLGDLNDDSVVDVQDERLEAQRMVETLNEDQKTAFDAIGAAVEDETLRSKCFFLDGPGGAGKTYLYKALIHYIKGKGGVVLPAATTGIAANLLNGGRTFHSLFRFGIPITEITTSNIKLNSSEADLIRFALLILIDESTMASCHALEAIDRFLRDLMGNDVPFGGKVILLGGDFRQCLAIIPHAMRAAIVDGCLKKSSVWGEFKKFPLRTNMRSEDPVHSDWLIKLGNGELSNEDGLGQDIIEVPSSMVCSDNIVNEIFGSSITVENVKTMSKRAILCPKNDSVDKINDEIMDIIDGNEEVYISTDSIESEVDSAYFPVEFLNSVQVSGLPPHKLKLKVGCVIILLRNLNTRRGLCNGTRLYVTGLKKHLIEAEVLTGSSEGNKVLIPRIDLSPSNADLPFKMKRRQFPVKLAFAMTINKSQGQTLDRVGIFLPEPVFGHGQLYVAFSRVRRSEDVKVKVLDTDEQGKLVADSEKVFTRNVVYHEVFDK